jgi:hypothetical protein
MTISKKHHKPHHLLVYMDNVIIKEVETHKHLVLTISEDGTIDVESLIFGNSLKNENENRSVFETVSKYIARTKRFD